MGDGGVAVGFEAERVGGKEGVGGGDLLAAEADGLLEVANHFGEAGEARLAGLQIAGDDCVVRLARGEGPEDVTGLVFGRGLGGAGETGCAEGASDRDALFRGNEGG